MNRARKRPGFLWLLALVLPIWLVLFGLQSAAAVEPLSDEELAARYAAQTLRVSIWLDKDSDDVYRRGEPLQVTFQANEDAYAVLYHIDVEGRVDVLWPTGRYNDGFVFGGHQYRLPAADGKRLRVGEREGLGYLQAVISRYPFDLRDLPLDFFHESGGTTYDAYVAGDPYLAMNEVNFTVTGLEDSSGYVITNHVSYYVHRQVDHPRYLCSQCHDDGVQYEPYRDSCTVTIRYDYGWMNQWWANYHYYPVYHYPTYYYIDPWTGYRWVNYWYDPWYRWPLMTSYTWPYYCYDWRYSPYWTWDSRVASQRGSQRYTPLDRATLARDRSQTATRTKSKLVTDARPSEDHLRAMKDRTAVRRADGAAADSRLRRDEPAGGAATNVRRTSRAQERFPSDGRTGAAPGLRLPDAGSGAGDARLRSRTERSGTTAPGRSDPGAGGRLETRRSAGEQPRDAQPQVRPPTEQPRDGGRVWTNRRSSGQNDQRQSAPPAVLEPARGDQPGAGRPQTERRNQEGAVRDRESSVRQQTPPPAAPSTPPPASPPAPPPTRSREESRSNVRERAPQSPPPSAPAPPPTDPGRSGSRGRSGETSLQIGPSSSSGHASSSSANRAQAQSGTGGSSRPVTGGRR